MAKEKFIWFEIYMKRKIYDWKKIYDRFLIIVRSSHYSWNWAEREPLVPNITLKWFGEGPGHGPKATDCTTNRDKRTKPNIIINYNKEMGCTVRSIQFWSYYSLEKKSLWYLKDSTSSTWGPSPVGFHTKNFTLT